MMGKYALRLTLVALVCLLLGTAVLAQASAPAAPAALAAYRVEAETASGPGYQLAGGTWQVEGNASGPGYELRAVGKGILQGPGCCCAYLPCMMRKD